LSKFQSPSRRIFIGSHSLPPSLVALSVLQYQRETRAWRDKKVVRKDIKTGDLVLKRKKNWENPGKLHESWEGPYIARETDMPGAFRLMEQTGEELPYSWNADSLKRYYP
jgi:hypothetical protein